MILYKCGRCQKKPHFLCFAFFLRCIFPDSRLFLYLCIAIPVFEHREHDEFALHSGILIQRFHFLRCRQNQIIGAVCKVLQILLRQSVGLFFFCQVFVFFRIFQLLYGKEITVFYFCRYATITCGCRICSCICISHCFFDLGIVFVFFHHRHIWGTVSICTYAETNIRTLLSSIFCFSLR